jgi:hypothetical protein
MNGAVAARANRSERRDARVALRCRQPGARDYHCSDRPSARADEPHPRDDRAGHRADRELDGVVATSAHTVMPSPSCSLLDAMKPICI